MITEAQQEAVDRSRRQPFPFSGNGKSVKFIDQGFGDVACRSGETLFVSMTERLLVTIGDAARVLSIGRTTMYGLVAAGEIEIVHIGRSVRVPVAAIEEYVERHRGEMVQRTRPAI